MKYLAFCDTKKYKYENRSVAPSASNVVKYMADVLSEISTVEIISPSRTLNQKGFYSGRRVKLSEKIDVIQPPSIGVKSKIGRVIIVFFTQLWLFTMLLFGTHYGECIVVYHSLSYMKVVKLVKRIKKLRIVMEIREIYSDINKTTEKVKREEKEYFQLADSYIFATERLNELINIKKKPYIIISGIYRYEKRYSEKFDDGCIHVVYAGTLRPEKGGALSAIKMAEYLDNRYYVHILGYGTNENIACIKKSIDEVNKKNRAIVSYDGVLAGEEFLRFLQKCNIGLAVQNITGEFNNTSFPSKILTYLSNGLDVLSTDIPVVTESAVGEQLFYCKTNEPLDVATELMKIDVKHSKDKEAILRELDLFARKNIKQIM